MLLKQEVDKIVTKRKAKQSNSGDTSPPGRKKLANAVRRLLENKDYASITTTEISRESGVNEALIYRYFGNKRGLLHGVLAEHLQWFTDQVIHDLQGIKSSLKKLRKLVWSTINFYNKDRILAKILLLEVRANKDYFKSETYQTVKVYSQMIIEIIQEGIDSGELKADISPRLLRQIILGAMEHLILPAIIHDGKIDVDLMQENVCQTVFHGIVKS